MSKVKWGESKRIRFNRYGKNSSAIQDITVNFK